MPRDAGGIYFLPSGNPVIPGTVIESDWANPTMSDIGQEVSDSLSRSGKGGMLAALRGLDGSAAQPTFSFTNEPSTGRFRSGPGQVVEAVDGVPVVRYLSSGLEQWDSDLMDWVPLTPRDALGTPFNPGPSNLTSTNVQDAIEEVNNKTGGQITADAVLYDDTNVYFPATTVQHAIDRLGQDVSGLAQDILDNADAIDLIGGDVLLLESRVGLNEVNIGNNSIDIGLNATQISENINDISTNQTDISNIKLEQTVQDSRITGAEDWTQFNWGRIQAAEADIASNLDKINTNTSGIASNLSQITSNTDDIGDNTDAINTLNSLFPGGVLQVLYGGTGVTNKTGTGAGVHRDTPTLITPQIFGGNLDTDVLGVTQSSSNNSTRLATTAFVQDVVDDIGGSGQDITAGDTAYGRYFAVYSGQGTWRVTQWSEGNWPSGGIQDRLPVTNLTGTIQIATCYTGIGGQQYAATTDNIAGNTFDGYGLSISVRWISAGEATYNAAFANKVPTDRYYNKATQTEHLEVMHGDWTLNPDVVILPPSSPFWGAPMGPDEVLTFDGAGIPLARVARVKPQEEIVRALLLAAGLTSAALQRALYLAGRGNTALLTTFDNDMDAMAISEAVPLEILMEWL